MFVCMGVFMAEGIERPLDILGMSQNKKIIVKTKQGEEVVGTLKAFDSHINVSMDDAEIRGSEKKVKLGKVLVRGDSIVYISPGE
jgi:small nuclear ribonucleoprotein